ncbi:hypothetical protein SBOR_2290 [Sclerotinia borealis F-4128]|uniref:Uncharacterized protein n=1 Tax=Sclerotinia borealis (strain F-4128) TaxID=1432307 RepID=W9CKM4_SCLBF|nr:hypothetical protein SBOR_2290 [Sclerotinia borealis F-4128]
MSNERQRSGNEFLKDWRRRTIEVTQYLNREEHPIQIALKSANNRYGLLFQMSDPEALRGLPQPPKHEYDRPLDDHYSYLSSTRA